MALDIVAAAWLVLGANACSNPHWTDPAGDQLPFATAPALDLVDIDVQFEPGFLILELTFDPDTTAAADLLLLSGTVDFDTDSDLSTGEPSHIDQFSIQPGLAMGVDFFITFAPPDGTAELWEVVGGFEWPMGRYPIEINGTSVSVKVPRYGPTRYDGIMITAEYQLSALVGNLDIWTDRAPNGAKPFTAVAARGDFDADGDVDGDDLSHFQACVSGPGIPQNDQDCRGADFDDDDDIDQNDFGVFQSCITGSCH